MKISIFKDSEELSKHVADWLVSLSRATLAKQDRFTIALSGGSTPKKLFKLLASDTYKDKFDWSKFHFFWGDERFVPFTDEKNNARMAFEELLDHVPVDKANIHIMQTDISPEDAVTDYDKILHSYFDNKALSFDLVLLGLGDNAHTLSLFPGYEVVHEKKKWVYAFYLKEQSMYRITLTAPIVNKAAHIAYLVTGGDKAVAVKEIIEGASNPDLYPAQVIKPGEGDLHWFLDKAAAADLSL